MSGRYDVYGVCPCGYYHRAPFGSLFHIHMEVCPACGTAKKRWKLVTAREKFGQLIPPEPLPDAPAPSRLSLLRRLRQALS